MSDGGLGRRDAHTKKMSGAGLPFFTSGSSPLTIVSKREKTCLCLLVFASYGPVWLEVATPNGMRCLCRCRTSLSAPGISSTSGHILSWAASLSSKYTCGRQQESPLISSFERPAI